MSERHLRRTELELEPERYELHAEPGAPTRAGPPRVLPGPRRRAGRPLPARARPRRRSRAGAGGAARGGDAPRDRRLAAHRRGRHGHRLHRQGRGRPEHPHLADPGRRRGAARCRSASIRLVMADTARVPFDAGHLRQPDDARRWPRSSAGPPPRPASCCSTWPPSSWRSTAARSSSPSGKVAHPPTGASLGFGELTKGQKLVEVDRRGRRRPPRPTAGRSPARRSRRSTAAASSPARTSTPPTSSGPGCCTARSCGPPAFDAKLDVARHADGRGACPA